MFWAGFSNHYSRAYYGTVFPGSPFACDPGALPPREPVKATRMTWLERPRSLASYRAAAFRFRADGEIN